MDKTSAIPDDTLTLTVAEAARQLRRSRAWGYAAAVDGRLPVVRTVAGLRVRRADLLAMIGLTSRDERRRSQGDAA
jgi:helix-turn-helix protein